MYRRGWPAERVALWLAVIFVAGGALGAAIEVTKGIDEREAEYRGQLDVENITATFHPSTRGDRGRLPEGLVHLSQAEGTSTVPDASNGLLTAWALLELLPWLGAAAVLGFLVPILRSAERGRPFRADATRRMAWVGTFLLFGVPLYKLYEWIVAFTAPVGASPLVEASLTISPLLFLPGLLTLVLAGIFRRGVELQDFERHTV